MGKVNRKWKYIGFPANFIKRILRVLGFVADQSIAEYARHAIQKRLQIDEAAFEMQKMEEAEIRERLKD